jgi:hypothetical protein
MPYANSSFLQLAYSRPPGLTRPSSCIDAALGFDTQHDAQQPYARVNAFCIHRQRVIYTEQTPILAPLCVVGRFEVHGAVSADKWRTMTVIDWPNNGS